VNLSTSTNHGTWTLNTGGGSVVDPVAGDGSATYNFVVGDAGVVQLNFTDSFQEIVNINVSDGVTTDPGNSADPDDQNITIANCSFRIALADGTMSACESELVTITVYNSLNAIATGYTGTVSLSTSTLNGNWALQTGSGIVTDTPGDDNGYATYAYDASDNGVVVLRFTEHQPVRRNHCGGWCL
jgi:deoxycytidylate deaminase